MHYFDTSALLPYYREEPASRKVEALLSSMAPPVLISDLTRVEFVSAVSRWVRMNEFTEAQARLVEQTFRDDIRCGLLLSRPLRPIHFKEAERWLGMRKTALRTLDGLHLAFCYHDGSHLMTCDTVLHRAAEAFGIPGRLIV